LFGYHVHQLKKAPSQSFRILAAKDTLAKYSTIVGIPSEMHTEVFWSLIDGSFVNRTSQGIWKLAPGVPHPRLLTGCEFWASWEVVALMGVDFCQTGAFRSLRIVCPVSCKCKSTNPECPFSCGMLGNGR
jgi:hypothetical protein